jgi:hypothetical protein
MRALLLPLVLAACHHSGVPLDSDTGGAAPTDADGDGWTSDEDCDDTDDTVHPDAQELCNGVDDDCDGDTDEDAIDASTWYPDHDGDGFGSEVVLSQACSQPSDHVGVGGDCDDGDDEVSPDATETCDGIDNDCDGEVDYEIDVPADYARITDAISAAGTGDRVCVLAGTYVESVSLDKDIVLEGQDRDTTVLDAGGGSPVLTLDGNSAVAEVRGFTLTGGVGSSAVVLRSTNSDALLADLLFEDNAAEGDAQCTGALVAVDGGHLVMDRIEVRNNTVACYDVWGLFFFRGAASAALSHVRLTGNTIEAELDVHGGFTVYSGAELTMDNLVIAGNTISARGVSAPTVKAIALASEGGVVTVTNAAIHGNVVDVGAGTVQSGVIHDTSGSIALSNVSISSNTVSAATIVATVNQGANSYGYCNIHDQAEPAFESMADPRGSGGTIDVDPGFVDESATDPARWDLTLEDGSAMRDQGSPDLVDTDGSRSDIGAYGGPEGEAW